MKKLLNVLGGGCGGGCKKIFAVLLTLAMLLSILPTTFATTWDPTVVEFEYSDETHSTLDDDSLAQLVDLDVPFFFRTNPDFSGADGSFLYGYGYGYFSDGYGYGYGFGYGYDYFVDNNPLDWDLDDVKFGYGMGSSYGDFTLPVDDEGLVTLGVQYDFEGTGDLTGLTLVLPAGLIMDGEEGWEGTITIEGEEDGDIPDDLSDYFDTSDVNIVTVDTGSTCGDENDEPCSIGLSGAAVIKVPYADFGDLDDPIVKILGADGEPYTAAECTDEEYTGSATDADELLDPAYYELDENTDLETSQQCYVYYSDYVYVATNHFTVFAAGPGPADDDDDDDDGGGGGGYTVKKVAKETTAEAVLDKVTDFADLLTLATTSWKYAVIQQMLDLGLFHGVVINGKSYFQPDNTMTRAMAATVIARYMGYDDTTVVTTAPFGDVAVTAWYASSVSYLKGQGVVNGKTATKFDPNAPVSRAEFFKMVVESYMKLHPSVETEWKAAMVKSSTYFQDVTAKNWFTGYMALAAEKGLMKGYVEGGIRYARGAKSVTRVESGSMLSNMLAL